MLYVVVFGAVVIMLIRETVSLVRLAFKCTQTLNSAIRVPMILLNKQVAFFQLKILELVIVQFFSRFIIHYLCFNSFLFLQIFRFLLLQILWTAGASSDLTTVNYMTAV